MTIALHTTGRAILFVVLATLAGCASIDFDAYKEASFAPANTRDTYLGRNVAPLLEQGRSGESAFYVVEDGLEALAIRLAAAGRAERSIDVQTYLIKNDTTSRLFVGALLRAADRGARVRLLLDDVFTGGEIDSALVVLHGHPNVQVRIFNPFAQRRIRALDGLTNFSRVNRRMHNKTFTVDNQITVFGGRNYADEYFAAHEESDFLDTDVLAIGPLVAEISDMFDEYWNHRLAVPVDEFIRLPEDTEAADRRLRAAIVDAVNEVTDTEYGEALASRIFEERDIYDESVWARYELVYDSPDKIEARRDDEIVSMVPALRAYLESSASEVWVVTPYFVPQRQGVDFIRSLVDKGVAVNVITNSLAANNHWVVHSGYAPYRKALLQAGASLYEVRPDVPYEDGVPETFRSEVTTLHSKLMVFDREKLFVGSFNWDPRSININSEMGVIIESPELGRFYGSNIAAAIDDFAYRLSLDESDKLRWTLGEGDAVVVYDKDPESGWLRRFLAGLVGVLPIKGQL